MNKIITLTDRNYFTYGKLFLDTVSLIDAQCIVYGPDLNDDQISILNSRNIIYKKVDSAIFNEKMQFLKFKLIHDEIDIERGPGGITFVDFDTCFIKDWKSIFDCSFDLGITIRRDFIKQKIYRAYSNGGVIFCRNTIKSKEICDYAMMVMSNGGDNDLPEYDFIFKTLEEGRPPNKTHFRTTLRWWVDQVFLSSFVLRKIHLDGNKIKDMDFLKFKDFIVCFFDCSVYNRLDPNEFQMRNILKESSAFIVHLKNQGRSKIKKISDILRKFKG